MADFRLPDVDGWLDFEEGPWVGARVRVRLAVPIATYFGIMEGLEARSTRVFRAALRTWATEALIEWNLVDPSGEPYPATPDGLERMPLQAAAKIVRAWLNAVPAVDLPFGPASPDGGTSDDSEANTPQPS